MYPRKTISNSYNLSVQQLTASEILQVPRLTTAQRNTAAFQVEGGIVYDTDLETFVLYTAGAWQEIPDGADYLAKANNLSDLPSKSTSRSNLGLGSAATHAAGDFCQTSNNLSDLPNKSTSRSNLGLDTAATHAAGDFCQTSNNLSDVQNALIAASNLLNNGYYVNPIGNDVNMNLITWYSTDGYVCQSNISLSSYMQNKISSLGLLKSNNLSDVSSVSSARTNLGLGTAATHAASDFLQASNNLSDVASTSTARTNLGLGSAATQSSSTFLQASNNLSDVTNINTAATNLLLGIDYIDVQPNQALLHPVVCDFGPNKVYRTNQSYFDLTPRVVLYMQSNLNVANITSSGQSMSSFTSVQSTPSYVTTSSGVITFVKAGTYQVKFSSLLYNQDSSKYTVSIGFQAISGTPNLTWSTQTVPCVRLLHIGHRALFKFCSRG